MNFKVAFRLTRVFLHVSQGLATCALAFPWLSGATRNMLIQSWSHKLVTICGIKVEQRPGAPALEHAMIVANHVSWLDIFVINSLLPCRFVAKSEIREWPVLGWLADMAGTVFLARGSRRDLRTIFKSLVERLHAGERVAFFPEGTTATQGTVLPFHANLFEAAVDAKVMVQPYALRYVDVEGRLHPAVDFIGDMTFAESMVAILAGPPVRAQLLCLAPLDGAGAHRRELAQAAQDAVASALA